VQGPESGAAAAAWCLQDAKLAGAPLGPDLPLDFGPSSVLSAKAAHDYDGDGAIETNAEELARLVGTQVSLLVTEPASTPDSYTVYTIGTLDYRFADGTFAG